VGFGLKFGPPPRPDRNFREGFRMIGSAKTTEGGGLKAGYRKRFALAATWFADLECGERRHDECRSPHDKTA